MKKTGAKTKRVDVILSARVIFRVCSLFFEVSTMYIINMYERLIWTEESKKTVYNCRVFNVEECYCRSPLNNNMQTFYVLDVPEVAIIIPVIETDHGRNFVMVRQWRHGARALSLEFPGGIFEKGESPEAAAAREMREETGYIARHLEKLGVININPAIMSGNVHFFLAMDLEAPMGQKLDEDEFADVEIVPWREVLTNLGRPPYIHALMGTAMSLYLQKTEYK